MVALASLFSDLKTSNNDAIWAYNTGIGNRSSKIFSERTPLPPEWRGKPVLPAAGKK